jgi:uncharacterized repeat protein (TIGR03803 family)
MNLRIASYLRSAYLILPVLSILCGSSAWGQRSQVAPDADLVQASDGNFYGTTSGGGYNAGTVFKITPSGTVTTLYRFSGGADGANPNSLTLGKDGNLYGTADQGGAKGWGTVFKMTLAGRLTTLYSFTGAGDGGDPLAGVTLGKDGNFYGSTPTTSYTNSTIYKITPAGKFTNLHTFSGGTGQGPNTLTLGKDGNFYASTYPVGGGGFGSVIKITPAGVVTTLYTFTGGKDGASPSAALTLGSDGNFYGTTFNGGTDGFGTVYKMSSSGKLTTLYSFSGGSDGESPTSLIQSKTGTFYGTAYGGGTYGGGTFFSMTTAGALTVLFSFNGGNGTGPNGLTFGKDGNLYGTTYAGGAGVYGTVFKVTAAGALTSLTSFGPLKGATPGALTLGPGGYLFGTTYTGGVSGGGTTFKVSVSGTLTSFYNFVFGPDGGNPSSGLTLGPDGLFYGTTAFQGAASNSGTVFKMAPGGAPNTLHTFSGQDGTVPAGSLARGSDGNYYGATASGGSAGAGTLFKISPSGTLTSLYTFTGTTDGASPVSLVLGKDGNFYGTTSAGGAGNWGTVFSMTPAGQLTVLHTFSGGSDGGAPLAALTLGTDGNFYGTTSVGGKVAAPLGSGTVFKVTPSATFTTLYSFTGASGGARPAAALTLGSDGNFYGTTSSGGTVTTYFAQGGGTVFKVTPSGTLTTLYRFGKLNDGGAPLTPLWPATGGVFYGTTSGGGTNGWGTIFKVTSSGTLGVLVNF